MEICPYRVQPPWSKMLGPASLAQHLSYCLLGPAFFVQRPGSTNARTASSVQHSWSSISAEYIWYSITGPVFLVQPSWFSIYGLAYLIHRLLSSIPASTFTAPVSQSLRPSSPQCSISGPVHPVPVLPVLYYRSVCASKSISVHGSTDEC